jgi:hypothetical protein
VGVGGKSDRPVKFNVSPLARVVLLSLEYHGTIMLIISDDRPICGCVCGLQKGVAAPMAGGRQQKDRAQTGDAAPECYPAKARGLGGKGH